MKKKYVIIILFNAVVIAAAVIAALLVNGDSGNAGVSAATAPPNAPILGGPAPKTSANALKQDISLLLRGQRMGRDTKNPNRLADARKAAELEKKVLDVIKNDPAPALEIIRADRDPVMRRNTFGLVERAGRSDAYKTLLPFYSSADNDLKSIIIIASGKLGGQAEMEFLSGLLKSEKEPSLRRMAVQSSASLPAQAAFAMLRDVAALDCDSGVRGFAVTSLGKVNLPETREFLKGLAASGEGAAIRSRALASIAALEGGGAIPFLSQLLASEKDGSVKHAILGHIGKIGLKTEYTDAALNVLRKYSDLESDPAAKKDAENRIVELMRQTNRGSE
jgi:HEAT repeat protein